MASEIPLGLMPEYVYKSKCNEQRIDDIFGAMKRYAGAGKAIPLEWVEELELRVIYPEGKGDSE